MSSEIFFDDWSGPLRIVLVGVFAYGGLIVLLRLSGKRTLSKMNAFDLVVTVALGSTLATILLDRSVALSEGLTAFALLVGAQFAISWLSVRSKAVRDLIKSNPRAVLEGGRPVESTMRRERISRDEIEAAIRQSGRIGSGRVDRVVLETDGSLSVIVRDADTRGTARAS